MTQFNQGITAVTTYTLAGTQVESGTDGFLSWGRWQGVVLVNGLPTTLTSNQGLHYVTGIPTPVASMPTGGTFTYNLVGATSPTFSGNVTAPGPGVLNSASLVGNFTTGAVNVNLSVTAAGATFAGSANGTISTGTPNFTAAGTTGVTGATTVGCSGSCALNVNGFFAGTGATRAGMLYQISTLNLTTGGALPLTGAAALAR